MRESLRLTRLCVPLAAILAVTMLVGCAGGTQETSSSQAADQGVSAQSAASAQESSGAQSASAVEGASAAEGTSSDASVSFEQAIEGASSFLLAEGGIASGDPISSASWYGAGSSETDWYVVFADRANLGQPDPAYLSDLQTFVEDAYETDDLLGYAAGTEWHRIAMAVRAAGGDPTSFGTNAQGQPIDLIADGTYNWVREEELSYQGSNALIYALLAAKGGGYEWPTEARYSEDAVVSELLSCQDEAGGFGLSPGGESTDITAMALQALAFYYGDAGVANRSALSDETASKVDTAVGHAIDYLSAAQNADGCYDMDGVYSSDTCSQVILALCALGIDPATDERFVKDGGSLADALMFFRNSDGGFASQLAEGVDSSSNILATRQAGCALTALQLLQQNGNGNFFDFDNTLASSVQKAA
ncbi:MAG: hypothetical protein IJ131_10330 [Eggerthellaceae bacterium]|nr:hypothetical protein [Eggerthellaceae bacterium]